MSNTDKLREIAAKWKLTQADLEIWKAERRIVQTPIPEFLSDLTALISEGYVERAKYDKAVRQRDELKEALEQIIIINQNSRIFNSVSIAMTDIAEAAIKNTER